MMEGLGYIAAWLFVICLLFHDAIEARIAGRCEHCGRRRWGNDGKEVE